MKNENLHEPNLFDVISSQANVWIEVILPLALPKTYTYSVPEYLYNKIQIGCRAEVVLVKNKNNAATIKRLITKQPA